MPRILGADQKECSLWERDWDPSGLWVVVKNAEAAKQDFPDLLIEGVVSSTDEGLNPKRLTFKITFWHLTTFCF